MASRLCSTDNVVEMELNDHNDKVPEDSMIDEPVFYGSDDEYGLVEEETATGHDTDDSCSASESDMYVKHNYY